VLCRQEAAAIARLWPVPCDEVVALPFNPPLWDAPSPALDQALAAVVPLLAGRRAAVLIDAALRPGWFGGFAAALLDAEEAICCPGAPEFDGGALLRLLLDAFDLVERPVRRIDVPPRLHERERHRRWLAACGVEAHAGTGPWQVSPLARDAATAWLAQAGLAPGGYIACCPGGSASTPLKRWPEAHFAAVLRDAGLPVLLLGSAAERDLLARLGAALALPHVILAAAPADLPLGAALLALARGWLANDSGPMHLAQAHGVPGVAIFGGGGRWPGYAPWAPGARGVVCPLPCFGCDWDCVLDHALCVESVGVDAVAEALRRCLAAPQAAPEIVCVPGPPAPVRQVLADASATYRAAQRDRGQRLDALLAAVLRERQQAQWLAAQESLLAERTHRIAVLEQGTGGGLRAFQICVGLGAGNVGDELMAGAFWRHLPDGISLDVPLFPEAVRHRGGYPPRHRYRAVDPHGNENADVTVPGLLVGATPVAEAEGLDWPLRFLAPRLRHFHDRGLPVDALGVGVEPLAAPEAKALFADAFLPIRSWTVRSAACRDALLALGVAPAAVKIGADWAWLHTPQNDRRDWAAAHLRRHGIDPARPLLVANVVNMVWRDRDAARRAIAAALDAAAARHGLQIAFLCNECRDGDFFDRAAARALAALMRAPAVVLPNLYHAPDEAVALLRHAAVTIGERYHFVVESVLAGTVPVSIPRGAKMRSLATELAIDAVGSVADVAEAELTAAIDRALAERPSRLRILAERQRELALRAAGNLDLLRALSPYAALWPALE